MTIRKNYFLPGAALPLLNDSNNMYIVCSSAGQLCRSSELWQLWQLWIAEKALTTRNN